MECREFLRFCLWGRTNLFYFFMDGMQSFTKIGRDESATPPTSIKIGLASFCLGERWTFNILIYDIVIPYTLNIIHLGWCPSVMSRGVRPRKIATCWSLDIHYDCYIYYKYLYHVHPCGCFQKYWYPQIINFNRVWNHYKPSILGGFPPIFGNIHVPTLDMT